MTRTKRQSQPRALTADEVLTLTDPCHFTAGHLKARPWRRQRDIQRSVVRNSLTTVKACHASGKTHCAGQLVPFHLNRYTDGKVLTTAPTLRQVKLLWEEVARARNRNAALPHGGLKFPEVTTTGMRYSEERYGLGASSSRGVNIQGFHGGNILIVVDEAPGVIEEIWDAIEGIRSGGNVHMLLLGNPVIPSGHFYETHHPKRKDGAIWEQFTISAFDTPNFYCPVRGRQITLAELLDMDPRKGGELDYCPVPYLIRRRWVWERARVWGIDHPKFLSRVLGLFPSQSAWSVFHLAWVEAAKRDATELERARAKGCLIQVGIDVAAGGDDETALAARVNGIVLEQHGWAEEDPLDSVLKVLRRLRAGKILDPEDPRRERLLDTDYRLGSIVVDIVGVGYHFAKRIADAGFEDVVGFNAGHRAVDAEQFRNSKSEAYWNTRQLFKAGAISGLADEECEAQLMTIVYSETDKGLTMIEPKEQARKRGIPSPDRAEALILSFAQIVPREQEYVAPFDNRFVIGGV